MGISTYRRIATLTFAEGATLPVDFTKLPIAGIGKNVTYLKRIRLLFSLTGTATAATAQRALYDLLTLTVEANGKYFGARGLSGADIMAFFAQHAGYRPRTRGNGDAASPATGAFNRDLVIEFCFDKLGRKPGDFAPNIRMLSERGAQITIGMNTKPATLSAVSGQVGVEVLVDERPDEFIAVPNMVIERRGVDTTINGTLAKGTLHLALAARRNQAALVSNDLTKLSIRADGQALVVDGNPDDFVSMAVPPSVTGYAAGFSDVVGATADGGSHYARFYPPIQEKSITKAPSANVFQFDVTTSLTDLYLITATSEALTPDEATEQMVRSGAPNAAAIAANPAAAFSAKTESKAPIRRPTLAGRLPLKLKA